jgi:ADP-ribose pyrophosphatase YjhB (NUDIX family)
MRDARDGARPDAILWPSDDRRLAERGDLARARALVAAYAPADPAQRRERDRILAFIDAHEDALLRTCLEGHLTASALVLDSRGERALLTHHRKLRRWLQLGGHVDGDGNLPAGAWREATEESGIAGLAIDPRPVDLDIHPIPARPGEPEHLHLDVRFVAHAPAGARETASEESIALGWFSPAELAGIETDESVRRLFRVVLDPRPRR